MIELNLLPPPEKELLNLDQAQRWLVFYGGAIVLLILGFVTLLGLVWFFILIQLKTYTLTIKNTESSFQGQSIEHQKSLIADFNQNLGKIDRTQQEHKFYSSVLAELANSMPAGARLEGLAIDETDLVTLSGFASKRSDVLLLKQVLEKSDSFTNVESPLSNLTKQTDINFSFKLKIKPAKLLK